MCSASNVKVAGLALLLLCFLMNLVPQVQSTPLWEMCGLSEDWQCARNIDIVPAEVAMICETCGNYWGNLPGFTYCCRCSEKVFGFCLEAVQGGGGRK